MGDGEGLLLKDVVSDIAGRIPLMVMVGEDDATSGNPVRAVAQVVERIRLNQVEFFPSKLHGYKLLRFEPKVTALIAKFFEKHVKYKTSTWEPRYNLAPVPFIDVQMVRNSKAADAAKEKDQGEGQGGRTRAKEKERRRTKRKRRKPPPRPSRPSRSRSPAAVPGETATVPRGEATVHGIPLGGPDLSGRRPRAPGAGPPDRGPGDPAGPLPDLGRRGPGAWPWPWSWSSSSGSPTPSGSSRSSTTCGAPSRPPTSTGSTRN